jgi:class 3 adenylate cyclase/predicted ATPase
VRLLCVTRCQRFLLSFAGVLRYEWVKKAPTLPALYLEASEGGGGSAMTFEELLDQAIALLQRRGRLTYRALKRQFDLDDDYLEDLKTELIKGQRLAVDEDGEVLVWIGGTDISPTTIPRAVQSALLGPATPLEAERRQLTVMFCDLMDSTQLSGRLDPEEYREVVRAYQKTCTAVIERYDGYVAQLLGDGLLVYFGYPQAHEDGAQRAVRTGLGIIDAIGDLHQGLLQAKGIQLAIRLGIHTGLVVVGEMGGGGRHEQLALGEVPNLAARLQGLAAPNTLVVSRATYQLIQGYFACQDLGEHTLRGVVEPITVYQILRESGATSRLDVTQPIGLTPLVGRESEVTLLLERWEQAKSGQGQVVLLSGDAGIGKSRLIQMLKEHVAKEPHVLWECRSSPYFENTALFPVTDLFQRLLQFQDGDTSDEKLAKFAHALSQYRLPVEDTVPLFAPLLALSPPENHYPPLNLSPQRQRQKTLETIVAILQEHAEHHPLLFIVEDLHWTDPSTLELLNLVIDQTPTACVLVLLTCRPHFQPAWHYRSYLTEMTINRLSHAQVEQIVTGMTDGKTFPAEVLQQIITKTDGVPLFVEEITKAILESGYLKEVNGQYTLTGTLPSFAIPATLQDSLMARLDRLGTAKAVAQYAAVIGRQFAYSLLQAVSQLDEATLQRELGRLVEAELLYRRGLPPQASYLFKHALIQDAAYESLLKSTRQYYHQQIAQVLEAQFPETAEAQPELLAHHYTEAGLAEKAVHYWYHAGQSAIERSAHVEAINHLGTGLALLQTLTHTPEHARQELVFQTSLGLTLMAVRGYGAEEVEQVYRRARELSQEVGDTAEHMRALLGLQTVFFVRANHEAVHALTGEILQLAQAVQDPLALMQTYATEGESLFYRGKLALARTHLEHAMSLYSPQRYAPSAYFHGHDPVVQNLSILGLILWALGYPDYAVQQCDQALTFAQGLSHPFSLAFALSAKVQLHLLRREPNIVQEQAEALITVSTENGFPFRAAYGSMLLGWAMVERGEGKAGIARIEEGLAAFQTTGANLKNSWWIGLRAEAYGKIRQKEVGFTVLVDALRAVDDTGEHFYEAELRRLKGVLLLQQSSDNQAEAETCFHHALEIARNQQAKSLELRAATSLARLWQQGKRQEAHDLLAPVYGWFTEGFDTADLQDAKALLEVLV